MIPIAGQSTEALLTFTDYMSDLGSKDVYFIKKLLNSSIENLTN